MRNKKINIGSFTYVKKSILLIYLIAAPLAILASTAFAMYLVLMGKLSVGYTMSISQPKW